MRLNLLARHATASFALLAAFGCEAATDPTTPREAAGVYALDSVTGRGPVSGSFTLTADGKAERRVRYANFPIEYVATGTFDVTAPRILFSLYEQGSIPPYEWIVRGELNGRRFSIHYPDPADGPDIVETYRR